MRASRLLLAGLLVAAFGLGALAGPSAAAPARVSLYQIELQVMCTSCHEPLAIEEASPGVLKTMGLAEHIANLQHR